MQRCIENHKIVDAIVGRNFSRYRRYFQLDSEISIFSFVFVIISKFMLAGSTRDRKKACKKHKKHPHLFAA